MPASTVEVGGLRAVVLSLDRFGTLQLGCSRNELLSTSTSERVLVTTAYARGIARVPETFADVGTGELLVYEDSFEHLAVAVREGSAAALFGASAGDIVALARSRGGPATASNGEGRNRTGDTAVFSHVLYQLSYLAAASKCRDSAPALSRAPHASANDDHGSVYSGGW